MQLWMHFVLANPKVEAGDGASELIQNLTHSLCKPDSNAKRVSLNRAATCKPPGGLDAQKTQQA